MRTDMLSYLPGDLLAKVDIVSMAHGLECRSPFLDHLLIEDALKIPFQYLVDSPVVKPMLCDTFKQWIPQELRTRPKMGFRIPLSYWMRGHENKGIQELADPNSFCSQFLNPAAISEMIAKNQSGNWDFGDRLWALLFLERWGRTNF
jgi:asparagine synthase (glutamine-hydrolysing)